MTQEKTKRNRQTGLSAGIIILVLVLLVGSFIGWKVWQGHTKRVEQARIAKEAQVAIKQIQGLATQYEDQIKLAASTGRIALSGPVDKLQTTRRQLQAITVPKCLERSKGLTSQAMDTGVNIFLDFMQDKPSEEEPGARATRMGQQFKEAANAFEECPKMPA